MAVLAVWLIALAGGFLPNVGYTPYLLMRNRSWNGFRTIYPDFFLSLLMGLYGSSPSQSMESPHINSAVSEIRLTGRSIRSRWS